MSYEHLMGLGRAGGPAFVSLARGAGPAGVGPSTTMSFMVPGRLPVSQTHWPQRETMSYETTGMGAMSKTVYGKYDREPCTEYPGGGETQLQYGSGTSNDEYMRGRHCRPTGRTEYFKNYAGQEFNHPVWCCPTSEESARLAAAALAAMRAPGEACAAAGGTVRSSEGAECPEGGLLMDRWNAGMPGTRELRLAVKCCFPAGTAPEPERPTTWEGLISAVSQVLPIGPIRPEQPEAVACPPGGRKHWYHERDTRSMRLAEVAGCRATGERRVQQRPVYIAGSAAEYGAPGGTEAQYTQVAYCCPAGVTPAAPTVTPPIPTPVGPVPGPGVQMIEAVPARPWYLHPAVLVGGGVIGAVVLMKVLK
jgi:hypothetical protein